MSSVVLCCADLLLLAGLLSACSAVLSSAGGAVLMSASHAVLVLAFAAQLTLRGWASAALAVPQGLLLSGALAVGAALMITEAAL